jgi:hypothetical protein
VEARLRWFRVLVVAVLFVVGTSTTTASAATFTYDVLNGAPFEIHQVVDSEAAPGLPGEARDESAVLSAEEGRTATTPRAVVNATNRATHELYKDILRAAMERPHVVDSELSSLMDELYRPGAQVGSGSTAAAVRAEAATGASVGGKLHAQKAADYSRALERWLAKNPTASPGDRAAAENVLREMQNALGGGNGD